MADAWKGISDEAECASRIHTKIQENLCDNEIQQIKNWQRENYQKVQMFLQFITLFRSNRSLRNINILLTELNLIFNSFW